MSVLLPTIPFDLHVLGPPLAFILSQDQTLRVKKVLLKFLKNYFPSKEDGYSLFLPYFKELYLFVYRNKFSVLLRECKGNIFIKSDKFIFNYFNKLFAPLCLLFKSFSLNAGAKVQL